VNPTTLTIFAAVVVPILVGVVVPWLTRRQTARQLKEVAEKQSIKEQAERDAAQAAGDVVSWEKINRALATTAQEERAAHRERIAELREDFLEEAVRLKRQTDDEMERYKQDRDRDRKEINRLSDRVEELTRQLAQLSQAAPKQ
jgi:gas vesicle protein